MAFPRVLLVWLALGVWVSLCAATQPPITAAPNLQHRQQPPGEAAPSPCVGYYSAALSCAAKSPGFEAQPLSSQLSCYCYSSSTWVGSVFDRHLDSCLMYLSTASPEFYSTIAPGFTGEYSTPCELFAPSATTNEAGCFTWQSIQTSCAVATSDFSALSFSDAASCLCYQGSTYAPSVFDGGWNACLSYYSTASPAYYSSITGSQIDRTPCASMGNIRQGPTATPTPTSAATSTRPLTTIEAQATNANLNLAPQHKAKDLGGIILALFFLILHLV